TVARRTLALFAAWRSAPAFAANLAASPDGRTSDVEVVGRDGNGARRRGACGSAFGRPSDPAGASRRSRADAPGFRVARAGDPGIDRGAEGTRRAARSGRRHRSPADSRRFTPACLTAT